MNKKLFVSLLALLSLALTPGCYVDGRHYDALPGDVTFAWSFDGYSCYEEPDIETVWINIPGERLEYGGYYACRTGGYDGITLRDFAPGFYTFDIEAIDDDGFVSYFGRGSFTVDGDITVPIDLTLNP